MKKYDNYKDSGIEWIGEIPEHWEAKRIKLFSPVKRGASPRPIDDPKYFDENGEYAWVRIADVTASDRYLTDTTQKLSELGASLSVKRDSGDFFLSIAGSVGKPMITKIKCCIHDGFVYFPKLTINPEFLYYIFQTGLPYLGLGKLGTQLNLNTETVGNIFIPIPSDEEIEIIANYLDHKTAQIETLISKKQQFISLLQEERTAVINQAVTKGLDPKVKMKDSGIEWLGEIPEHWEVKKLKYLLKENKDSLKTGPFGSHIKNSDYIPNGSHKVYTQRNVLDNEYENGCESISEEKFEELKGFTIYEGDVLITTRGSIGRCSVFPENIPTGILHPCLIRIQVNENLSLRNWIVNYINNTSLFYNNVKFNSNSTIIDVIYGYTLKEIFFPTPSIIEQKKILEFLEVKINEIDTLISKSQQEIELLKEYKTALISEVVTGKVDVRNLILN